MSNKTIPIEKAVEIAAEMHRAGQFQRAEAMYREILRQDPGNIDAIHLLGLLANQGGRPDMAIELIGRAVSRRPDAPTIQFNYADALAAHGQLEDAVIHYERAIELAPEYLDAFNNLSTALGRLSRFEASADAARRALEVDPQDANAHNNLGNALRALNRNSDAVPHYEAAIRANPLFPEAFNNYGLALCSLGLHADGIAKLNEAIRLAPTLAEAHNNLGVVLANMSRTPEAIIAFETTLKLAPEHAEARNNLSSAFRSRGNLTEALKESEEALKLKPDLFAFQLNYVHVLKDLSRFDDALVAVDKAISMSESSSALFLRALILRDLQRPDEAIDSLRQSLKIEPNRADVLSSLGYALQERGELDEALELLNKSISMHSDPQTHSNVMMVMCYHPNVTPKELFEAHRSFARIHEDPIKPFWKPHAVTKEPERRLRIGYFSPDMRGHVVSYFSTPIFENHEHEHFEIYAYSNHFAADNTTLMHRARFDHWRETAGLDADKIAALIRDDKIDILVELAGHTALNGLAVLARKPAPIQLNAIGFPSTTGLTAVDYRVTDRLCDPPGIAEAYNSEKLLYMPDIFWCYQPPEPSPAVGPLPADMNQYVTFISVNNFTKVTNQVLKRWAEIVARTPNSKIILQTLGLSSEFVRERVRNIFSAEGVSSDRLDMRTMTPFYEYLKLIESSDIMLDPFPFNGGTTTCHSLWMGCPVVSLAGHTHAGRMGLSMLTCIGLPELCAPDEESYVTTAVALAQDLPRLREVRAGLRDRLQASPMLDGPKYVKDLETSYRTVWREWCAKRS